MAFTKFAKVEVLEVRSAPTRVRTASLSKFADFDEYRTDDGYMYVRVRAISSRVNKNHDGWPSSELSKAYRTFIGKPIFVDHHNHDPKRARGVIVDAALHVEDEKTSSLDPYYASAPAEHLPPTWIELLLEVDAKQFPKLAQAVINDEIDGVSMGANVEMSKCSHCGNEARSPEEFCKHVQSKGAYFDYTDPRTGQKTSKRSYEDCYDIGFFEISFVFDPADETALKMGDPVYAKKAAKIAAIREEGLVKEAIDTNNLHDLLSINPDYVAQMPGVNKQIQSEGLPLAAMRRYRQCPNCGTDNWRPLDGNSYECNRCGQVDGSTPTVAKTAEYKYVKKHGDKWVITQKGTGKVLSEHDSEEQAKSAFRAMEMHMHSSLDGFGDWDAKLAYGEESDNGRHEPPQSEMTTAPDKVNTLRQEQECPVCGSTMEDGVCEVCNYEEPPEGFDNPDLQQAGRVDQQLRQDDAQQAAQGAEIPQGDVTPPPPGPPAPMPSGAMPATSSTSNANATADVKSEKTAATNGGRINTQERPILPATRQLSDKPIGQKTVSEAKKPVESNNKENMSNNTTQKTADGATPQGEGVQAEKRVDVEGVGAVSGDPLSGIEHENVEKDTGDFTAPHTDTWSAGEGDSLGQHDPVTSETGDFFTVSHDKTADTSADLGGPLGEGVGDGGSAKDGGPTWDKSDAGFPDHQPARVDLNAPLKEEVGEGTKTFPSDDMHVGQPVTKDNANDLGGPIGVAVASAKSRMLKAMRVAETEVALGLREAASKFERIAELEDASEEVLDATLKTLSSVKTAGLKKASTPAQKTAGATRMPSFAKTASFDIEAHAVEDDEFGLGI